jgi:hypothetical protein
VYCAEHSRRWRFEKTVEIPTNRRYPYQRTRKHIRVENEMNEMTTTRSAQCITMRDLAELTNEEVEQAERAASTYKPSDCDSFYKRVRSLESLVTTGYKLAVVLAKRTEDSKELRDIWKSASDLCDPVLKAMKSIKDSQPDCGTSQLYDLVLDYKNAAFKRYQLNSEALEWQTKPAPAGIFPESN